MWYKEYLNFIHIDKEWIKKEGDMEILSKIITNHQIYLPFDTVRKFQDFKSPNDLITLYKDPSNYIRSIKKNGLGGTCFHFTWALYNLLTSLNFKVSILKLEHQHFALSILLGSEYFYIDVGFWSPLFKPMPLNKNWNIEKENMKVEWKYSNGKAILYWNGTPAKEWKGEIVTPETFFKCWKNSMTADNFFLNNLYLNKWIDKDNFIFLVNNKYTEFYKGIKKSEIYLNTIEEIQNIILQKFQISVSQHELYSLCQYS